jgi:hypothetical protein
MGIEEGPGKLRASQRYHDLSGSQMLRAEQDRYAWGVWIVTMPAAAIMATLACYLGRLIL